MISKPTPEELQPLLSQVEGDWIAAFLGGLKALLRKTPLRYREFGPYWWLLKKALVVRGDLSFGSEVDLEWAEAMGYGDEALDIAAAMAYLESREGLNVFEDTHTLEKDGEAYQYVICDSEVEIRAAR